MHFASMRLRPAIAAVVACLSLVPLAARGQPPRPPYRDSLLPTAERVRDLLGRMTVEEKFWQLFMLPADLDDPAHDWSHGAFGLQVVVPPGAASPARAHAARIDPTQR